MFQHFIEQIRMMISWAIRINALYPIIFTLFGVGFALMNFIYADILSSLCFTVAAILLTIKYVRDYKINKLSNSQQINDLTNEKDYLVLEEDEAEDIKYDFDAAIREIFEENDDLSLGEFVQNLVNCAAPESMFTYDIIIKKITHSCNYLLTMEGVEVMPLSAERHAELIFVGKEDSEIYINKEGFRRWVEEKKIRLPEKWKV
ncbi:hypothetical protein Trichorick_00297 [Candidatus Trichorickettsia mobilis]|uniref:Uncharacterized protein n=1 Tax=Candidatus Trichorickettsia mobilis TaxID=1346319 RepID=A0ABZ0UQW0_9RICK|nr:hypothetical protein [Candidatus Trichorickettsia mobilis]WPY00423.1 hypothetical protein Trichorick_00297 [Candidatus Trichorickettsia mobilis]